MRRFCGRFVFAGGLLGGYSLAAAQSICTLTPWLPTDYEVFHVGTYSGITAVIPPIEFDDSGHTVKSVEVAVNYPAKPVVLVLSAYDPVLWKVAVAPGSRVVGAFVTGYHPPGVVGLPKWIPLLVTNYPRKGGTGCGYLQTSSESQGSPNALIKPVAGKDPKAFIKPGKDGVAWVGVMAPELRVKLTASKDYSIEEFTIKRAAGEVPAGRRGIEVLLQQGALRKATEQDMLDAKGVTKAAAALMRSMSGESPVYVSPDTYVVLKPLKLPESLYGGNAVTFIIPRGVPFPKGDQGHNAFYVMDEGGKCRGAICM